MIKNIKVMIACQESVFGSNVWTIDFRCDYRQYSSAKSLSGDVPQETNRRSVQRGYSDEVPNTSTSQVLRQTCNQNKLSWFIADSLKLHTVMCSVCALYVTGIIRNDIHGKWLWCGGLSRAGGSRQSRVHAQTERWLSGISNVWMDEYGFIIESGWIIDFDWSIYIHIYFYSIVLHVSHFTLSNEMLIFKCRFICVHIFLFLVFLPHG